MRGWLRVRIAAHIGVKDERDLIERVIAHLRAIGVDLFVVCDMYSTDGTAEILDQYVSDTFRILKVANSEPAGEWLKKNKQALERIEADWIVFLDADEFLLPQSGSLRDALAQTCEDILYVRRYNVPLCPTGPMLPEELVPDRYAEVQLLVKSFPNIYEHLRNSPKTPWIRAVPGPKIIARQESIAGLTDGMHEIVTPEGRDLRRAIPDSLVIAHVPMSTKARFERKIQNIRECFGPEEVLDFSAGQGVAWHWRRWLYLAEKGELDQEFERSRFSMEFIDELRRDGNVRNASEIFAVGASKVA